MRQHQTGQAPSEDDTHSQKYCIIFGDSPQAEQKFALAVIFVPFFKYIFLTGR